ncbi:MAG: efflux RND transporter permease subunit, partial [Stellaceae bacterium]
IYVNLLDTTPKESVTDIWLQVRKKVADIKGALPQGVIGPNFNDEFGDVFGIVYAFTADGFTPRELRDYVEAIRTEILTVKNAAKALLIGAQDQKFYLEFDPQKLAGLGVSSDQIIQSLREQNAVIPSGVVQTAREKYAIRVSGSFDSVDELKRINLYEDGKFFRLADVATVKEGYADPPQPMFRFDGQPAIGLAISMAQGGNILTFGAAVEHEMAEITANLPIGIEPHLVANQPEVVEQSVHHFTKSLWEAIAIVLAVSFLSLGLRAGLVVACSIPLVLAIVFAYMEYAGISLQRISLGALIISLGLLVDDAMITIEMMVSQLEAGVDRDHSATHAWVTTAFPMLTGTLVTVAGFVPIGFANSGVGEYCYSLFAVIAVALLASWIVAVLFAPLIGVTILPKTMKAHGGGHGGPGRVMRVFGACLRFCMRARWLVIAVTIGLFAASLYGYGFIQQQFFPASDRPELVVDLTLPQNSSIYATEAQAERFEQLLKGDSNIERYTFYVGQGAVRFYLPLNVQLANDYFAEAVIVTRGLAERDIVKARLEKALNTEFADLTTRIFPLEMGPPVGWPLQYRVSAPTPEAARTAAFRTAEVIGQNPNTRLINFDWNEPMKSLRIRVDQDKVRQLGVSSASLSDALNAVVTGTNVTQVRDSIYLVDVVARAPLEERASLQTLRDLQVSLNNGKTC